MNLSWSHYKALLGVHDQGARRFYELRALEEGWSRDELRRAIRRVEYEEQRGTKDKGRRTKRLKRPTEATYVYAAKVERVVDGDTLILRIDLGFQVWKEQRIRLAQIDTPPLETAKGREAFEYARNQLARVPFVVVRTNKIDIHGRYVGDIFYSFHEKKADGVFRTGRYLNQELVDLGLADVF